MYIRCITIYDNLVEEFVLFFADTFFFNFFFYSGFPPRRSFNSRNFAKKYNLTPYALLTYYAEWDERVPEFAAKLQGQ